MWTILNCRKLAVDWGDELSRVYSDYLRMKWISGQRFQAVKIEILGR